MARPAHSHWDREGRHTDQSSCWIRVAQAWAGAGFGAQFIPRVGMEVLVSFLGGNCDRPIVTGCVHNTHNPTPYRLPEGKQTSGIRTRSSPGGTGYNELSFDDTRGHEHVVLRSERDLDLLVRHEKHESVGGRRLALVSGDDELQVTMDRRVEVRGDDRLKVEGNVRADVHGNVAETVFLNRSVQVRGIDNAVVGGAVLTAEGSYALRVEGDYTLRVGAGDGVAQTNVAGNWIVSASKDVRVHADGKLTLLVGPSSIEISADGITLNAPSIKLKGGKVSVEGNGPKLTLGDEAELVAKSLKILTESASLKLDKDAQITGTKIKLGGPKDEPEKKDDDPAPETKPFNVKLADEDFQPYAQKHYEVVAGGKRFEGSTGGDGGISIQIAKDAALVEITGWIDTYPTGRKKHWTVRVADLPPAKSPKGALHRLKNLGYYVGVVGEALERSGEGALRWFQKDHDLEETGKLDAKTASELERVHGG